MPDDAEPAAVVERDRRDEAALAEELHVRTEPAGSEGE